MNFLRILSHFGWMSLADFRSFVPLNDSLEMTDNQVIFGCHNEGI